METGKRIKLLIKKLGMNQEKFSINLGLSQTAVSKWINNSRQISPSHLQLIHEKFNVSLEWLEHGKGEMFLSDDAVSEKKIVYVPAEAEDEKTKLMNMLQSVIDKNATLVDSNNKLVKLLYEKLSK